MAGVNKEIWAADIAEKIFPNNQWMQDSIDESAFVDGSVVHSPVAGANPNVVRNRKTVPAVTSQRDDLDADWTIDEFTSDPTLIRDIEETETSYDKRASVLKPHTSMLNLQVANWMLYKWAATQSANIVRTTGANRAALASQFGATSTRKKITLDDVLAMKAILDDMDLDSEMGDPVLLMPATMYNDLLGDNKQILTNLEKTGEAALVGGKLTALWGFKVYKRGKNNLLTYDNSGTPVPRTPTAAASTSANAAALAWHPSFVLRAKGEVKVFVDEDSATHYGSILSALLRAGGRKRYLDETGVVALVEAA